MTAQGVAAGVDAASATKDTRAQDQLPLAVQAQIPGCAWAMWFDREGRAHPAGPGGADNLDGAVFCWFHFDRSDVRVPTALSNICGLEDENARDALIAHVDHQYVEVIGPTTYGAIIDHEKTFEGRNYETDYLRFAFTGDVIVTSRRKPLQSTESVRRRINGGAPIRTPAELFDLLVSSVCACVAEMNQEIAHDLDKIEDRVIFEDSGRAQRAPLGRARREAVRLARQIGGIHSTILHLAESAAENEREDLGEIAAALHQRSESLMRDVNNLQDRARALQEEVNAILTLETNDRLYSLTIITTLILPATFVTGLFGMNTQRLFFSDNENGTIWATFLCVLASCLALIALRRFGLAKPSQDGPRQK